MNGEPIMEVRGMTKRFGDRTVVDHVDLTVRAGEIFGFLGPNGSGKTTFVRMLCGLLRAGDGSGTCLGHDVIGESEAITREVGYMTQRFSFWEDLSIAENLDSVARMYGVRSASTGRNPAAHNFVRIVRGILLKGNGTGNIAQGFGPIALFTVVAMFIAMKRYRQTLD